MCKFVGNFKVYNTLKNGKVLRGVINREFVDNVEAYVDKLNSAVGGVYVACDVANGYSHCGVLIEKLLNLADGAEDG